MLILQSLSATVLSMAKDSLYMSITVMGPYMMLCMGMMNTVSNFHGMHALGPHLELQEL